MTINRIPKPKTAGFLPLSPMISSSSNNNNNNAAFDYPSASVVANIPYNSGLMELVDRFLSEHGFKRTSQVLLEELALRQKNAVKPDFRLQAMMMKPVKPTLQAVVADYLRLLDQESRKQAFQSHFGTDNTQLRSFLGVLHDAIDGFSKTTAGGAGLKRDRNLMADLPSSTCSKLPPSKRQKTYYEENVNEASEREEMKISYQNNDIYRL